MTIASDPDPPDELDGLFARVLEARAGEGVALAVSGGSDSTALMVLFADWLRQRGADPAAHTVLTVDHRLRPKSAAEAEAVAGLAAKLGFPHATLVWEGPKPQTGLQAAAREARYRLMGEHLRAHGIATLLTAHTRDDQAETLLMRLARGSGLDGLAGIAPSARMGPLLVLRPLLDIPKARLRATLEARGIPWIEDPSNQSPAFERTRLRAAGDALAALGLTSDMLALSARRLQRARAALDSITDSFCAEPEGAVAHRSLRLLPYRPRAAEPGTRGDRPARARPMHCRGRRRRTSRCRSASSSRSSTACAAARTQRPAAGRWPARSSPRRPTPSRSSASPAASRCRASQLAGGTTALWDGRFAVAVAPGFEGTLEVRALGTEGLAELRRLGRAVKGTRALHLVPSFWRESTLLAVPALDFWAVSDLSGLLSADFVGLRYNSGVPGERPIR